MSIKTKIIVAADVATSIPTEPVPAEVAPAVAPEATATAPTAPGAPAAVPTKTPEQVANEAHYKALVEIIKEIEAGKRRNYSVQMKNDGGNDYVFTLTTGSEDQKVAPKGATAKKQGLQVLASVDAKKLTGYPKDFLEAMGL